MERRKKCTGPPKNRLRKSQMSEEKVFSGVKQEKGVEAVLEAPPCFCNMVRFRTNSLPKNMALLREHAESGGFKTALEKLYGGSGLVLTPHYNNQSQFANLGPLVKEVVVRFPNRFVYLAAKLPPSGIFHTRNPWKQDIPLSFEVWHDPNCPFKPLKSSSKPEPKPDVKKIKPVATGGIKKSKRDKAKDKKKVLCWTE